MMITEQLGRLKSDLPLPIFSCGLRMKPDRMCWGGQQIITDVSSRVRIVLFFSIDFWSDGLIVEISTVCGS